MTLAESNTLVNDITITSLETITLFDVVTGDYLCTLDELQNASIANTQEVSEITGRQGRKLANLKRNKAVTVSGANGMVSGGLLALQTGGKFENKNTQVMWTDYLAVGAENKASTTYKAIGSAGSEIVDLYIKNADSTIGSRLEQTDSEAESGKFTYSPETKELQFFTDVAEGTEIVVYYMRQIKADVLTNQSDVYSGKATMYIDCFGEDKCANVYRVQFFIPKADFSGEFTLEMGCLSVA